MKQFLAAKRAGVPLVAISSPDAAATIAACLKVLNGAADKMPQLEWNIVDGLSGRNEPGRDIIHDDPDSEPEPWQIPKQLTLNPTEMLSALASRSRIKRPSTKKSGLSDAIVFLHMSNRIVEADRLEGLGPCQGIWNCRDNFKSIGATLVLMGPSITLPAELRQDVISIDEPLPEDQELGRILKSITDDAEIKVSEDDKAKAVSTLRGLSAFASEQCVAMSLTKTGVDMPALIKLKRSYVSQLPGVEVREDKITFDDIAGYEVVKNLLRRKIAGKRPPRLVIWWDEFDRTIAGNKTDTSGTSQDQMACLLQWAQDRLNEDRLSAAILVGVPGSAKSAITAATHNEAQCECLRWDLGGVKDSLVGSSEKRIRQMLKVCDAMCGGHILILATANSLDGVPSPVISRFALGTYFFSTPTEEEGKAIWKLKRKKYGIPDDEPNPTDDPWTGREIQQCCFIADDLRIPLKEAANYITPYFSTNSKELESLKTQAHKRWLSASTPGFYMKPSEGQVATGRKIQV